MTYKTIRQMKVGEVVESTFLLSEIERRVTQKGKPYGKLTFKDKSGQISVNVWDFDPQEYSDELKPGVFVATTIEIQDYRGTISAVSKAIPMPVPAPADLSVYEDGKGLSSEQADHYYDALMVYKDLVKNPLIKTYLDVMFVHNKDFIKLFKTAPASASNRGAYRGGLVEHVYKVMLNAEAMMKSQQEANNPAPIDVDVVIASVLTHDIGKVYSYSIDSTGAKTTRAGHLLQHLPMSYGMSIQAFIQAESILRKEIPEEIKDHINHCILAHHGALEYGSPVKPQSLEAQIVHNADMADSMASNFAEPTIDNAHMADESGMTQGTFFSSKRLFVGKQK